MTVSVWTLVVIFSTVINCIFCVLPLLGFVELTPARSMIIAFDLIVTNVLLVLFILLKLPQPPSEG